MKDPNTCPHEYKQGDICQDCFERVPSEPKERTPEELAQVFDDHKLPKTASLVRELGELSNYPQEPDTKNPADKSEVLGLPSENAKVVADSSITYPKPADPLMDYGIEKLAAQYISDFGYDTSHPKADFTWKIKKGRLLSMSWREHDWDGTTSSGESVEVWKILRHYALIRAAKIELLEDTLTVVRISHREDAFENVRRYIEEVIAQLKKRVGSK